MQTYFAVVFTDLVRHSLIWDKVPRNAMTTISAEYRYLAQSIASQYGRRHENFTGDGHLFLFESADVAAHFGLKLIAYWKQRRRSLLALHKAPDLPIRVGCHFGECSQLADADDWVGRAINLAKRVEAVAEVDALFYAEAHNNYGVFLERRNELKAAEQEYLQALGLRPDYAEAHYNYAILLENEDPAKAEEHYRAALHFSRDYAEAHNNLAILLHEKGDLKGAEEHYAAALRLRPRDAETNYNFGLLLQAKGDKQAADRYFQRSIELTDKSSSAN